EAGGADLAHADVDDQRVVEPLRRLEVEVRGDDHVVEVLDRADPLGKAEVAQVVDAPDLQIDEEVAVEHDAHRIGLRQAHTDLGLEVEWAVAGHRAPRVAKARAARKAGGQRPVRALVTRLANSRHAPGCSVRIWRNSASAQYTYSPRPWRAYSRPPRSSGRPASAVAMTSSYRSS